MICGPYWQPCHTLHKIYARDLWSWHSPKYQLLRSAWHGIWHTFGMGRMLLSSTSCINDNIGTWKIGTWGIVLEQMLGMERKLMRSNMVDIGLFDESIRRWNGESRGHRIVISRSISDCLGTADHSEYKKRGIFISNPSAYFEHRQIHQGKPQTWIFCNYG